MMMYIHVRALVMIQVHLRANPAYLKCFLISPSNVYIILIPACARAVLQNCTSGKALGQFFNCTTRAKALVCSKELPDPARA